MIIIAAINSYIPEHRISNFDRKGLFEIDDNFIRDKLGVHAVSQKALEEDTSDLCVKAFERLRATTDTGMDIECLVVCTQNPDGHGIPHTSAVVHGKLDLPETCACFDISLGCSGYVYTLSIVKAFMEAHGFRKGLLFTADPYSKTVDPLEKNTALLFGDAATVTFLREGQGIWAPKTFRFASRGKEAGVLHNRRESLYMNGRAIFNFSAVEVPLQVQGLLEKEGLGLDEIDLFIFHQGSKYIIDRLRKRMSLPEEKVPLLMSECGNTISSSIPLVLEKYASRNDIEKVVLCGFGVGLSWASGLLTRKN